MTLRLSQRLAAELTLITFGIILIADSFFFHAITFDYARFGLEALDPIVSHWMIGVALVLVAVWDIRRGTD